MTYAQQDLEAIIGKMDTATETQPLPGAGDTFPGWAIQAAWKNGRCEWYLCDCRRGRHHFFNTQDLDAGFDWMRRIVRETNGAEAREA